MLFIILQIFILDYTNILNGDIISLLIFLAENNKIVSSVNIIVFVPIFKQDCFQIVL